MFLDMNNLNLVRVDVVLRASTLSRSAMHLSDGMWDDHRIHLLACMQQKRTSPMPVLGEGARVMRIVS